MKALVATDFHGNEAMFERFALKAEGERAEVLVVCGDVTQHPGTFQEAKHLLSLLTRPGLPVFFVPGNCDPPSIVGVDMKGVKCIHGRSLSFGDVTFVGSGGSPHTPFKTPFEMTEEEIAEMLVQGSKNLIVKRWFVLVSHAPPHNTRLDKAFLGHHVGSLSVRRFIEEKKPSIVFCGHIHEARGKDQINNTILVNPGPARHGDYVEASFGDELMLKFGSL